MCSVCLYKHTYIYAHTYQYTQMCIWSCEYMLQYILRLLSVYTSIYNYAYTNRCLYIKQMFVYLYEYICFHIYTRIHARSILSTKVSINTSREHLFLMDVWPNLCVFLFFIKPILGNRYVRFLGFIVSEPRETHPRSE